MKYISIFSLFSSIIQASPEEFCSAKDVKNDIIKPDCHNLGKNVPITLPVLDLDETSLGCQSKIFFIESSDRTHLLTRQACAVESAVKNAQIEEIYILMTSKVLNVNNGTCQLLNHFNVKFR